MVKLPAQSHSSGNSSGNGHSRLGASTLTGQRATESRAEQAMHAASGAAKNIVDKVGQCIADHPGISLAAAVSCGVVIGWLIKRSS